MTDQYRYLLEPRACGAFGHLTVARRIRMVLRPVASLRWGSLLVIGRVRSPRSSWRSRLSLLLPRQQNSVTPAPSAPVRTASLPSGPSRCGTARWSARHRHHTPTPASREPRDLEDGVGVAALRLQADERAAQRVEGCDGQHQGGEDECEDLHRQAQYRECWALHTITREQLTGPVHP
jgi:hypothetical protein